MKKQKELVEQEELEEWEEGGFDKPFWVAIEDQRHDEINHQMGGPDTESGALEKSEMADECKLAQTAALIADQEPTPLPFDPIPIEEVLNRRTVYDLEESLNAYGRIIYVEQWDETTGKPKIWYEFNKQKILVKYVRRPSVIIHTYLGKTKYI
jgi:hypothetical protein